jgi:AraC-like DNA-binding protein
MIGKTRQTRKAQIRESFDVEVGKPRGLLKWPPPVTGEFEHLRRSPPADLRQWIEHYWMVRWNLKDDQSYLQETLPHPNVQMVFENGVCRVAGICTGKFSRVIQARSMVFGIKFQPGGFRPFIKDQVSALLNRTVIARSILGSWVSQLEAAWISPTSTPEKMIDVCNRFFRARLPKPDPAVELATNTVALILRDPEIKSVDTLARQTQIPKRSLQRLFREYVGVHPKWVIRRYRLHELVAKLDSGEQLDLAQVALDLGYFDQAHLINDFRSVVGHSPLKYLGSEAPPQLKPVADER